MYIDSKHIKSTEVKVWVADTSATHMKTLYGFYIKLVFLTDYEGEVGQQLFVSHDLLCSTEESHLKISGFSPENSGFSEFDLFSQNSYYFLKILKWLRFAIFLLKCFTNLILIFFFFKPWTVVHLCLSSFNLSFCGDKHLNTSWKQRTATSRSLWIISFIRFLLLFTSEYFESI